MKENNDFIKFIFVIINIFLRVSVEFINVKEKQKLHPQTMIWSIRVGPSQSNSYQERKRLKKPYSKQHYFLFS